MSIPLRDCAYVYYFMFIIIFTRSSFFHSLFLLYSSERGKHRLDALLLGLYFSLDLLHLLLFLLECLQQLRYLLRILRCQAFTTYYLRLYLPRLPSSSFRHWLLRLRLSLFPLLPVLDVPLFVVKILFGFLHFRPLFGTQFLSCGFLNSLLLWFSSSSSFNFLLHRFLLFLFACLFSFASYYFFNFLT